MRAVVDTTARSTVSTWKADTNAMVSVELVRSPATGGDAANAGAAAQFHPTYTYPFYGTDETVLGYLRPRVTLRYSAASLALHLVASYDEKSGGEVSHDSLVTPLLEYLPPHEDQCFDEAKFAKVLEADARAFVPPGHQVHQYEVGDETFELFQCKFTTPGFKKLYDRFKIFPMFLIEAATPVDADDARWDFVLVYRKRSTSPTSARPAAADTPASSSPAPDHARTMPYEFVGMASLYTFFLYPSQLRRRLAQLLILPPFQRRGHAQHLYAYLLDAMVRDREVGQFTIEDPSDAMDAIRDAGDLAYLFSRITELVSTPPKGTPADPPIARLVTDPALLTPEKGDVLAAMCAFPAKLSALATLTSVFKLHRRQAERVYEMAVLHALRGRPTREFRLMVKARIFRANRDALAALDGELDAAERVNKIHAAYLDVLKEYRARLAAVARR
ncbi:histone acetyltransferase 1 [Blastocladiella emersonii ATCC 22665]|nr:histone acetyltransferase 1 [Blastocladiella emersonii ATCC 22665]